VQDYCLHVGKNIDLGNLPAFVRFPDLKEHVSNTLAELDSLLQTASAPDGLRAIFASVVKRVGFAGLEPPDRGRRPTEHQLWCKALYQLPIALATLSLRARDFAGEHSQRIQQNVDTLTDKTLGYLVTIAARRLPQRYRTNDLSAGVVDISFSVIGQGAGYWAVANTERTLVALVAKTNEVDTLERLRHRWVMAKEISCIPRCAGHPRAHLVATTPFVHAFFDFAQGDSVAGLYQALRQPSRSSSDAQRFRTALRGVGARLRCISDVPVEGFGDVVRSAAASGGYIIKGSCNTAEGFFSEHNRILTSASRSAEVRDFLVSDCGIESDALVVMRSWFQDTFLRAKRTCLTHPDPHLGNFLYNFSSRQATILDWERAVVAPEPVMLGRMLQFTTFCDAKGELRDALFQQIMGGYEPDSARREKLISDARRAAAVQLLTLLVRPARSGAHQHSHERRLKQVARKVNALVQIESGGERKS